MEKTELTALVVKAQSGDQEAMEEVLRAAHTSVSYQCRKLLRDPRDAEDMTQEVLLAVYTKLDTLKTPEAFWGWLNQTTANRCVNAMKRSHVEFQFAEDEEGHSVLDNLEELDEQQVPDKALDNAETTRMIEEIVDGLPDAQRVCTLMYYYDEMSVREIASALEVSENTVKSRLNYARKAVKERVLDYEKKGVKLYGLSPLPFMLFFLLRAASESADSAKAAAAVKKAMEAGAAAAGVAGGAAAGAGAGGAAAGGAAAAGGLSAKVIAGTLAALLLVGGTTAAVVVATQNAEEPEPVVSEVVPEPTEEVPEETEEPETPPAEEELIPADRLALLDGIAYYGDPAQCRMTVNQARAYMEVIETRTAGLVPKDEYGDPACYAALIDVGEGNPVLTLACGTDYGERLGNGPDSPPTGLNWFDGKLEVYRYADGQAELAATAHTVYWKAGEGLVCHTRVGGTEDENGNIFPGEAQSHYLDFSEEVYRVEGGVLSASPIASALVEIDLDGNILGFNSGGTIDGQLVGEAVWPAWKELWDEGGRKSIVISQQWAHWEQYWAEDGWTGIFIGYDVSIGGYVDHGLLNLQTVSPGSDAAGVLRQCAGD